MRHADDGAFQDSLDIVDHAFHFLRVDIQPAGNDQVLVAADDADIAVGITHRHVAGDEEAVLAEGLGGFFRHFPIAEEDIVAALLDDADLAIRQRRAGLRIGNPDFHAGKRKPDGAGAAVALERVRGAHVGFGHAVALEDRLARQFLELAMRLCQQRGRPGNEQPHVRRGFGGEALMVQKPGVEGRHTHHRGGFRHPFQRDIGREFRQEDHRAADHRQQVACHEQPVRVIDRQHVEQRVIGGEAPVFTQHLGVRAQVPVAQLGALGTAGGAGGIENGGKVLRSARHCRERALMLHRGLRQAAALVAIKRHQNSADPRGDGGDGLCCRV